MLFKTKHFDIIHGDGVFKINTDALLLGSLCPINPGRALDIGTGSGIIALILAQRDEGINIDAIDNDLRSINVAKENFQNSKFSDRLQAEHADIANLDPSVLYSTIITNPPYYISGLQKLDSQLQKKHAIDSTLPKTMAKKIHSLLAKDGVFSIICNDIYLIELINYLDKYQIKLDEKIEIYGRPSKPMQQVIGVFRRKIDYPKTKNSQLYIYNEKGAKTEEYLQLMRPYLFV